MRVRVRVRVRVGVRVGVGVRVRLRARLRVRVRAARDVREQVPAEGTGLQQREEQDEDVALQHEGGIEREHH